MNDPANLTMHRIRYGGVEVLDEAAITTGSTLRQEHVHHRSSGVDLKLVIAALVDRRLQEDFKDIVMPGFTITLGDVGIQVRVLHLSAEIEVLAIP